MALAQTGNLSEQLFNQLFTINLDFNVLICKTHQIGINYTYIKGHINTLHRSLQPKSRAALISYISSLLTPIYSLPNRKIPIIQHLKLYLNGLKCSVFDDLKQDVCGVIYLHKNTLLAHYRKEHKTTKSGQGRPKKAKAETAPFISNILCQKFFNAGPDQRLFEVSQPDLDVTTAIDALNVNQIHQIGLNQLQTRQIAQSDQISQEYTRLNTNPWLDRAGWAKHLTGFDAQIAVKWLDPPFSVKIADLPGNPSDIRPDLDKIRPLILKIVLQHAIDKAYLSIQPDVIGLDSLFYINRKETGAKNNDTPIQTEYLPNTIQSYIKIWYQILIYFHNTWYLQPPDRPNYVPSANQQASYAQFIEKINKLIFKLFDRLVRVNILIF